MSSPQICGTAKNAAQCNPLQSADSWKGRAEESFLPPWSSVFAAIKCKYISSRQVEQRPSQDAARPQLHWVREKKSKWLPSLPLSLNWKLKLDYDDKLTWGPWDCKRFKRLNTRRVLFRCALFPLKLHRRADRSCRLMRGSLLLTDWTK